MFEFLEQDLLVRIESVHMELDNLKDSLSEQLDRTAADYAREITSIHDQHVLINQLRPTSKMSLLLGDLRKSAQILRESGRIVGSSISKLSNFQISSRPLHRDKSLWLGRLSSNLKPFAFSDLVEARVKLVDLFDYTTNLTSMCSLDDESVLVLDNYLNSVSLFDKNFNLLKSVCLNEFANVRQSRLTFNSNLYGVTASSRYVYINNSDRNQIVVLDRELRGIKAIFAPLKCKSIFEVETYEDLVFVLDNQNRQMYR